MQRGFVGEILCLCLSALLSVGTAVAAEVRVNVLDADGNPVRHVAVFINQSDSSGEQERQPASAVMDQVDVSFVPHILIVEKGAEVDFPNSDVVAHHVYSFSRPNDFVLPLYKGKPPGPVTFSDDGIVTLGCNIHDGMLGYIVVVDTSVFGMTDEDGTVTLEVDDASRYEINAWSPRFRDSKDPLMQAFVTLPDKGITFQLQKKLRPEHVSESRAVQWDEY